MCASEFRWRHARASQKAVTQPRGQFLRRQIKYTLFSITILLFSINIGTAGYHFLGQLPWIESFLNASMILTCMGPVNHLNSNSGKIFSALYACSAEFPF